MTRRPGSSARSERGQATGQRRLRRARSVLREQDWSASAIRSCATSTTFHSLERRCRCLSWTAAGWPAPSCGALDRLLVEPAFGLSGTHWPHPIALGSLSSPRDHHASCPGTRVT
jgi:hypothetical protein